MRLMPVLLLTTTVKVARIVVPVVAATTVKHHQVNGHGRLRMFLSQAQLVLQTVNNLAKLVMAVVEVTSTMVMTGALQCILAIFWLFTVEQSTRLNKAATAGDGILMLNHQTATTTLIRTSRVVKVISKTKSAITLQLGKLLPALTLVTYTLELAEQKLKSLKVAGIKMMELG